MKPPIPMEKIGRTVTFKTAQRMCIDKKRFASKNEARDFAIRGQKLHGNASITPYRCPICFLWHLSSLNHTDGNKARRAALSNKP